MQVVIDVNKEDYAFICSEAGRKRLFFERPCPKEFQIIAKGTVLPEGHGRLVDQDVFLKKLDDYWNERKGLSYADIVDLIRLKTSKVL